MAKTIKFGLSVSEIKKAQKQIETYQKELVKKCETFARRMSDEGVMLAKIKLTQFPAIDTGELLESIKNEPGIAVTDGSTWVIYTGCEYAAYVEFGFGLIGASNPHPDTSIAGWKYDVNQHGTSGWFYFKNNEWHWSGGQPSKPFMYETGRDLRLIIPKIAKEVFGNV